MVTNSYATGATGAAETYAAAGSASAVAWPAIFGGVATSVATGLILTMAGAGFGLSIISPFGDHGPGALAFSVYAGLWLIVTQWLSSAVGGYIAGRMRVKWAGLHTHEVFFRDTANGFITWAVATLVTIAIVASGIGSLAGAAMHHDHHPGGPMGAHPSSSADPVSRMLRPAKPDAALPAPEQREEAHQILATALTGAMSEDDRSYLSAMIIARDGVTAPEAYQRIDAAVAQEKAAAEAARKTGSATLIFGALSMLAGAFVACVAAAIGGQQRDEHI